MKKLQSNFTTPEQSNRLLELGVPAWTADCYYSKSGKIEIKNTALDEFYPACWSVGRLIEIYHICVSHGCSFTFHVCFPNLMNEIMYKLSEANCNGWLNLSKLEESYV
jgi:hypothetical protein